MKKILIVNNNMHIGGVQKALVSLLWGICERYDVTLLLLYPGGECLNDLPPNVKVITADSGYRYLGMTKYDVSSPSDRLGRAFFAAVSRVFGRKYAIGLMKMGQKKLGPFDVAVSYLHDSGGKMFYGGCNDFVLNHVSAQKKVAFLHCDYRRCGADTPDNAKKYAAFDVIAACSRGCAEAFVEANPALKEKVQVVYNCHRFDKILADALAAPVEMEPDKIHIVTVARLGREKGVERALRAIARLGERKDRLHYYIVGDGIQRDVLLKILEEENLSETVTMCGMLPNPYGYIRAADLLLIPSYNEAAPLVIGEAVSLGTPVLSTLTSSAVEMIEEQGCGWVCDNSEEGIAGALEAVLANPSALVEKQRQLAGITCGNEDALARFDRAIG